jgi:hypothetical protein
MWARLKEIGQAALFAGIGMLVTTFVIWAVFNSRRWFARPTPARGTQ